MHKLSETSLYFTDASGHIGLTRLQKYTIALHQLSYDMTADTIDEYLKLGKSTDLECHSIIVRLSLSVMGLSCYVNLPLPIFSVY
jgi:hypothetical protein